MNCSFRSATLDDLERLLTLVQEFHLLEHMPYERESVRRILSDLLSNPALGQIWIVEAAAEVVGYAVVGNGYSVEYGGRNALIDELYLVPSYRKKGIGMRFLKWIINEARSAGFGVVHLEVDLSNERAFEVYKALGFKAMSRRLMSLWAETN